MGLETEYAVSFFGKDGRPLPREALLPRLMDSAGRCLPHLSDGSGRGIFAANGARLYVDCGSHPEYSTPEVEDPWQAVRFVEAGDRTLLRVAQDVAARGGDVAEMAVFRTNVDYVELSTWGCHESYLHRALQETLARQIVPHLVTRAIFAGAGGFNPFSPGLEFTLSARAPHIVRVLSGSSTAGRGIFHTKQESLCRGFGRLHLLCGDSVRSQTSLWLAVGTTALVVAMAEAGLGPGEAVQIRAPLSALRTFAKDPECRARVRMARGGGATSIEIQRHYLSQAQANLGHACMPPWAGEVCARWRTVLDALERNPLALAGTLEWPTKLAVYREHVRRDGDTWNTIVRWNRILRRLKREAPPPEEEVPAGLLAQLLRVTGRRGATRLRQPRPAQPTLLPRNESLEKFRRIRREFLEIDTRWGRIGSGLFAKLDEAGVLRHRVEGIGDVDRAVTEPPAAGRARIRGETIRELGGSNGGGRYVCGWEGVYDQGDPPRFLDLSDPFVEEASWKPYMALRFEAYEADRGMAAVLQRMGF